MSLVNFYSFKPLPEAWRRLIYGLFLVVTTPAPTYPPPPPAPQPPDCEYMGEYYPPDTVIQEPGCMRPMVGCDPWGVLYSYDSFGQGCCQYNGQYYEDGDTFTREDGVVCHCVGSETGYPAPMICPEPTDPPPPPLPPYGCVYGDQVFLPGETIYEKPGCMGGRALCSENSQIIYEDYFGYGCCLHNDVYYENGATFTEDGLICRCEGSQTAKPAPVICEKQDLGAEEKEYEDVVTEETGEEEG
ncbi:uncharacterized protein LOC144907034 [Branchiostoma floridae x Branchiostoma belcheri]